MKGIVSLRSVCLSALLSASLPVLAAPGGQGPFAPGFNGDVTQLPPGRLRTQIEALPAAAQQQALAWLARFNIPTEDYDFLNTDQDGALFYTDTVLPDPVEGVDAAAAEPQAVSASDTFKLHSRPGASKVVFLDFDGHLISGTAWNNGAEPVYEAKPFDTDGVPGSFSDSERNAIAEIWHRVAEDMAPFDIDVTTEDPGSFGPTTGHVLITAHTDQQGLNMPHSTAGGVAYVGVWGASYYTSYQPALVYYTRLGSGHPPYVSEAASHEFGHNLGLSHDGVNGGSSYYSGHGSGNVSWGPIMGVGYYTNVTQWSKGEYSGANNKQDDIQIIADQLAFRADDHGATLTAASPLQVAADGTLYVTFPEIDPHNQQPANKGVIERAGDSDLFWFDTGAGGVTLTVTPAWEAFYRSSLRGANLDIEAALYDQAGNLVALSDPDNDTYAQIDTSLSAGRYYLAVRGVGNTLSPYSDYGSLGMYFISGSVQSGIQSDTTPPNPDPMGWASAPAATGRTGIGMTARTATDDSGVVQYWFQCVAAGGSGCSSSGWQSATAYTASGLTPGADYSYQVKARDAAGNETGWSPAATATTLANQPPQAVNDSAETPQGSAVTIAVLDNDSDADGDSLSISGFTQPASGSVTQSGSQLVYTPAAGFNGPDSFSYSVTDGYDTATARVDLQVIAGNSAPVAQDDSASVAIGGSVNIDVLANDSDPDGDSLSILSWTQGGKGSVALVGSELVYQSNGKRGGDTFSYTISDGNGGSASAVVNVSVSRDGGSGDGGDTGGKCHPKRGC